MGLASSSAVLAAAKGARRGARYEGPGDRLGHSPSRQDAARPAHAALGFSEHGARHAARAGHRRRRHLVEADDAHHLLDEVGGPVDVGPPARRRDLYRRALALDGEAQRLQGGADLLLLDVDAGELGDEARLEVDDGYPLRRRPGDPPLGRCSARDLHHQGRGEIEARQDERGIDAPLEAVARIGDDAGLAARCGRAQRIEIGALDEHVAGLVRAARVLAAQDAAEAQRGAVVGDHAHRLVGFVLLAVEALEFLALAAEAGADGADELVGVVDVQGAAAIEADVVGDVDQRVDGAQAHRLQALLHPGGRGAVADAADEAAGEAWAGVRRLLREFEPDVDGAVVVALDAGDLLLRLEPAEAGGGEVAGNAAHARAVGTIGRELHVDHRVGEAQDVGVALAELAGERRIELDDALVVVGEFQLPLRHQHALRDDAAHGTRLQRDPGAGDIAARGGEHADHAGLGIGRAAHHLDHAGAGVDLAHLQLVGIGMALGLDDPGDGEGLRAWPPGRRRPPRRAPWRRACRSAPSATPRSPDDP